MRTFGSKWFKDGSLIGEFSDHLGVAVTQKKQAVALHAAKVDADSPPRPSPNSSPT